MLVLFGVLLLLLRLRLWLLRLVVGAVVKEDHWFLACFWIRLVRRRASNSFGKLAKFVDRRMRARGLLLNSTPSDGRGRKDGCCEVGCAPWL